MIEGGNFNKSDRPDSAAPNPEGTVESLIAIYATLPGPRTQATWREWLHGTNLIEGDLDKKARVMLAIQMGVDYVEAEAAKQGIDYKRPLIGVIHAKRDNPSCPYRIAQYNGTRIFITTWHLDDASQYSFEQPIYNEATLPEYFFLAGVEEGNHALFDQREGEVVVPRLPPDTTPPAEYHAQDHEYEALQWKIKAAKSTGVPENAVRALQNLFQAATAVRREQAAKSHAGEKRKTTSEDDAGTAEGLTNESLHAEGRGRDEDSLRSDDHRHGANLASQGPLPEPTAVTSPPLLSSSEGTPLADLKDRPNPVEGPPQGNRHGTPGV